MSAETTERPDSALYNYDASCTRHLSSPDVPMMCDTLFSRAAKAGNNHFRVLAYLTKLDYYYFRNDKNKVPEYAAEAKRMCREYGKAPAIIAANSPASPFRLPDKAVCNSSDHADRRSFHNDAY